MTLLLDPRQRAMLAEMGVRTDFLPAAPSDVSAAAAPSEVASPKVQRSETRPQAATPQAPSIALAQPLASLASNAVSEMAWDALAQSVRECQACGLCKTRKNTVFGVGAPAAGPGLAPRADWLIVGEAPGENEDLQSEPFVGQAGRLLDNMLKAMGLSRRAQGAPEASVYIVNVLKCRPPGNRNPQPEELLQCAPFLERQVALLQPKIIVAMGRFAVQSLLKDTVPQVESIPLGKLRGQIYSYRGIPVVVTYHPAYLLRSLAEKAKAWADLCLALSRARRPQD
jgi:uracil-DNA glycosylase family 4